MNTKPTHRRLHTATLITACLFATTASHAAGPVPVLKGKTDRPLRYRAENNGFVIDNGPDSFNRPLYGGNSAFRVDAGDKPEFSFYLPGRGGVVRVGLSTSAGTKWLRDAEQIQARYADGAMTYRITDPSFGGATVNLTAVAARDAEGLLLCADVTGNSAGPVDLIFAYGGMTGEKAKRDGDIGTEALPVSQYFALKADHCKGNEVKANGATFSLTSKAGRMVGVCDGEAVAREADGRKWDDIGALIQAKGGAIDRPIALTQVRIKAGTPATFLLQHAGDKDTESLQPGMAAPLFDKAVQQNRAVAQQVVVDTPDPFVNSAVNALCVAADSIWDDASGTFMHGGVAWRRPYLGWRGPYAGDAAGWHDRTQSHLDAYFAKQNIKPIPATQPGADEDQALARSERALRSNGDFTDSHYDMNLVAVDAFFRHLLWTGDLEYARKWWPAIKRHLDWEKRQFRRPFGPDGLPLYEAYAAIWASDDLQYSGGGAAHSSAYNYYHNLMAARVAKLLGEDPASYQKEADLIRQAMNKYLWLPEQGQFAECKDWLGNQLVHPAAAAWTHYHTIDSQVPDAKQAWQMCRYVDTQLPHIPITGKDVPPGCQTIATSTWMPYTYSINNVVMAETEHTALADWQAGQLDAAFSLYKGAILDSMFLGQCPGNCAMTSFFDPYRQEAQRDFGDPIGITWRATVEGLFGITPDLLNGELTIAPGFPADWDHASIKHPDLTFTFNREDNHDTYTIDSKFAHAPRLRLRLAARGGRFDAITINGKPAEWKNIDDAVGTPQIEITADAADHWEVQATWGPGPVASDSRMPSDENHINVSVQGAVLLATDDPANVLKNVKQTPNSLMAEITGNPSRHSVFLKLRDGSLIWWQPVDATKFLPSSQVDAWVTMPGTNIIHDMRGSSLRDTSWSVTAPASTKWDEVNLASSFNDDVTSIFKNKYVSPRSPFCSLALPVQGYGGWSTNKTTPSVDDTGMRAAGGKITLPQGVPFTTPSDAKTKNVLFVSQWDNYPREAVVPLTGKSGHAYFLMAGTTNWMQSRLDNGEVIVTYADGSTDRLALRNPETWWPIEQDYFVDDYAFNVNTAVPPRVDLKTGKVRLPTRADLSNGKQKIDGGSATVLDLPLDPTKELKSLTVRAIANDVVIGLMSVTLQRPN